MSTFVIRHPPSADEHKTGTLLALGVHAVLVIGLTIGVSWRSHEATPLSAELWAAVPKIAAPEPAAAPTPPPPKPAPPAPQPTPPKAVQPEAQIATQKTPDKPKAAEKHEDEKAQAKARADAEALRKKQEEARQKQEQERLEKQREENLRRLAAQLPGSAPTPSPGKDEVDAGPSASYAGRVRTRIFPNIVFTDLVPGRAIAEVQVNVAPDGKITGRQLRKSSGVAAWDDAVLRAIDKTEQLPLDEGRAPPASMLIEFDANQR